jgi:hypothetical protein
MPKTRYPRRVGAKVRRLRQECERILDGQPLTTHQQAQRDRALQRYFAEHPEPKRRRT